MEALESQIAKILLGNNKSSQTYVYVMAEKAPVGEAELYLVAELPLFNPAAEDDCERICLAIASAFKRSYRRESSESTFENAISQINEELGKLAAIGQTQWINKLSCVIAVKQGINLSIASSGKISAYLLRGGELTDISCSQAQSHPLKTFENFAVGKIRLGDLILLSTAQLFNYVSMDRLLNIFGNTDFLTATQTVIQLLKENAEPQVSFGTLLNLQVPEGQTEIAEMDLENYVVEQNSGRENQLHKILNYVKTAFAIKSGSARVPKVALPGISFGQKFKNFSGNAKTFLAKGKNFWMIAKSSAKTAKNFASVENLRQLSSTKKFFLASAAILLIALAVNIAIAVNLKKVRSAQSQTQTNFNQIQALVSSTQASLLYKDNKSAADYFKQAKDLLSKIKATSAADKDAYNKLASQLSDIQTQMEKVYKPKVDNLGSLGAGDSLIKLPDFTATQVNSTIISYQKSTGQIKDTALKLNLSAVAGVYLSGNTAAVYDGSNLYIWDFSADKILGAGFSQSLPAKADFAGLAEYPTNKRVYVVDKKTAQIISFLPGAGAFSKPVVAVSSAGLSQAVDITIDSNIYVLSQSGVDKFQSGKPADFSLQNLPSPLSGQGKIYTQKDFKYLYILDSGNNRILIFDKTGNLVNTLISDSFTGMKDFQVDEKGKTIFVLNDGSLLKVTLP